MSISKSFNIIKNRFSQIKLLIYIIIILLIFLTSLVFIAYALNPPITNIYEGDTEKDYDEFNNYDYFQEWYYETYGYYYYNDITEFAEVIYVHKDGSNADGETWETAYTHIQYAIGNASSDLDDLMLIIISPGEYDLNIEGVYVVNKNIQLWGVRRNLVTIRNNHTGSTGVLQFNDFGGLFNIHICCGKNKSNDGVIFNGTCSKGSRIESSLITARNVNETQAMLILTNGTKRFKADDLYIEGNKSTSIGIYLNNSMNNVFEDVRIYNCSIGLHLNHTNDEHNVFKYLNLHVCTIGVQIDSGADYNQFTYSEFTDCNDNINDNAATFWFALTVHPFHEFTKIFPDTTIGTLDNTVTGHVNVDEYGAWKEIVHDCNISNPFKILGYYIENCTEIDVTYMIQVSYNCPIHGTLEIFATGIFHMQAEKKTVQGGFLALESGLIPACANVSVRIRSENGGSDTCEVWLTYIEY